ncbi:hypothetical protein [[Clostridium] polysaccharolyticum]|uniref:FlgN protein n=1 Tax=[Clostridium] polysaccharolyticum TaxID=29364 RepID=A0A1I0CUC3_9FIRM|nr:hypothetical protein [[Clostridium] polysaccharolyticum]SET23305.1 hypothetical protein SAMN04487772_11174 [[Clostridium] polysaccharolyticum]
MNNIVYVKVLADSLQKKYSALQSILDITKKQEELLFQDFEEESFLETIAGKQRFLDRIAELDNGFEVVYNRVRQELALDRSQYGEDIASMQKLIAGITELGMDIEVLEKRNKMQMDKILEERKGQLREMRRNNSAASNYYRNMVHQQYSQSYFLDKKK